MKLLKILKTVGSGIIKTMIPGSGIIDTVNALLPDSKKLSESATGNDVEKAIAGLSPEARAQVLSKQFDVDITNIEQSNETLRAMLEHDAANPQSTRPKIAYQAFQVIAVTVIVTVSMWAYAVVTENTEMVETIMDGWPFIVGVTSVLSTVLLRYFGSLDKEHQNKAKLAGADIQTGLSGLIGMFKK